MLRGFALLCFERQTGQIIYCRCGHAVLCSCEFRSSAGIFAEAENNDSVRIQRHGIARWVQLCGKRAPFHAGRYMQRDIISGLFGNVAAESCVAGNIFTCTGHGSDVDLDIFL